MIYIPTTSNLVCGNCYQLNINISDFTTDIAISFGNYIPDNGFGEPQFIKVGDIGVVTANGNATFTFDTPDCQLFNPPVNAIELNIGDAFINSISLILDEACVGAMCSECYTVRKDCYPTIEIIYWNEKDSYNLRYLNTQFKQSLYIQGSINAVDYPYNIEQIHKYGNGLKAPIKTDSQEVFEIVTKQQPTYIIDALRIALKSKYLMINGESYCKVEGSITPEFDVTESLASQVVFQVQKNNQDLFAEIV